jgi:hypothetical protein
MSMPASRMERKESFESKRMAGRASLSIVGFDARDSVVRVRFSEMRRKTLRDEICQMLIIKLGTNKHTLYLRSQFSSRSRVDKLGR